MTFPTGQVIPTSNLSSSTAKPSDARADLLLAVETINTIVADSNAAYGVAVLDGAGQILSSQLPAQYSPSDDLVLAPTTAIVKIQDILRLQVQTKTNVLALTGSAIGDVVLVADDLTGVNPKLALWDGSHWKYLALSSLTTLS
jgi:hypothetical protein